jgi:hypothetical protein
MALHINKNIDAKAPDEESGAEQGQEKQPATEQAPKKADRERSTIQFAYLPLEDAVAVATGVHSVGGPSCQIDQLAAHLNLKADTGSFRLKLGNAKLFGFITASLGTVTLTNLGSRVCDPAQEQAAKAEAFLGVPLYSKVYEQFKGGNLPPVPGLETAMVNMGVSPKQKTVARQVFQRSATQAGFFAYGSNRLVPPAMRGAGGSVVGPEAGMEFSQDKVKPKSGGGGDGGDHSLHPLIAGLIKALPESEKEWPIEKRAKWLRAAAQNFDIIYPDPEDGSSIEIKVQKVQAQ